MLDKFRIEIIDNPDYWDCWMKETEVQKIFYYSFFYKAFNKPYEMIRLYYGDQIIGGWIFSYENKAVLRPPLVPYTGLFYCLEDLKHYRYNTIIQNINNFFCDYIHDKYDVISIRLSPSINDVQYFIWSNFKVNGRYTYILPIRSIEQARQRLSSSMKRNIKNYASKYNIEITTEISKYLDVIKATRTSQATFKEYAKNIESFLQTQNCGACFVQKNEKNEVASATFVVWDKHTAYYLAGGFVDKPENKHASETALWKAIEYCSSIGIKEFDFEGSMIPGVEEFFRKFGGEKRLYFHIKKEKKNVIKNILLQIKKLLK